MTTPALESLRLELDSLLDQVVEPGGEAEPDSSLPLPGDDPELAAAGIDALRRYLRDETDPLALDTTFFAMRGRIAWSRGPGGRG